MDGLGRVTRQQLCRLRTQVDIQGLAPGLYYLRANDALGQVLARR